MAPISTNMAPRRLFAVALALLSAAPAARGAAASSSSSSIVPTKNYIDTITGYIDLSTCAEGVLSTVVRAQMSGCGDNRALTSYTCFCTDSSSYFRNIISTEVTSSCAGTAGAAQASSAVSIFDAYCALGVAHGLTTASEAAATASSTAAPAASASTFLTSTTASPATASTTTTTSSSSSSGTNTPAIAAGVAVPVGVIGLALVGYLFYRKRLQHAAATTPTVAEKDGETAGGGAGEKRGGSPQELAPQSVQEMPNQPLEFHELDGTARHEAEAGGDAGKR